MILLCFRWDYYTGRMPQLWRHLARNMMDLGRSSRNNMWWYSLGQVFSLRHVFRIAAQSCRHGLPRNSQRDVIWKCLASKTNIQQDGFEICAVPSGPHFVNQDPGWGPKGQPKGHKVKCQTCTKNISEFLLDFMRSYQDLTFSTRIQDGSPRDNQRDQKRKCLTGRKPLATFYWILWGPTRTSLFPSGSRMGSQGATKGKKTESVWQVEKP